MKLKRFITKKEADIIRHAKKEIECFTINRPYARLRAEFLTKTEKSIYDLITKILKNSIIELAEFSCFVDLEKNNDITLRVQYNWEYDEPEALSFIGVGYITLTELQKGFDNEK